MSESITSKILALQKLTVSELQQEHKELFGIETRSRHKQQLLKKLCWRIQELEFGGLSERTKRRAREIENDLDCRILPPRKSKNHAYHSYEIQPTRFQNDTPRLTPGMILSRQYKDEFHQVLVMEDGAFEYRGQRFKSLSGVAKKITGTNWNGKLFFGLKKRGNGNGSQR